MSVNFTIYPAAGDKEYYTVEMYNTTEADQEDLMFKDFVVLVCGFVLKRYYENKVIT